MKKLTIVLFSILFLTYIAAAQAVESGKPDSAGDAPDAESVKKGSELLSLARKAARKGKDSLKIDGFIADYSVTRQTKIVRNDTKSTINKDDTGERQLNALLPDKFKYSETIGDQNTSAIYNYTLNGEQMENETYGMSNGQRMQFQINGQAAPSPDQKLQTLLRVKKRNAFLLFPVILEAPNYTSLEFHYVGKAEAGEEKADVVEASLHDKSSFRLFFDEQTHLLKMAIISSKTQDNETDEKRYYSDYREINGILVAGKINIETKQSGKVLNSEMFEEMTLKSLKFNPSFKADFFQVKN